MSAYLPKSSTETDFATAAINRNPSPALNTFPIPTNEILVIDFEEAAFGVKKKIKFRKKSFPVIF